MHVLVWLEQRCRFVRRDCRDLVLVHLVNFQDFVIGFEEFLADVGEVHGCVREFPLLARRGFDAGSERSGEELVPETDTSEFHLWSGLPEFGYQAAEFLDPRVVAVSVVHGACYENCVDV